MFKIHLWGANYGSKAMEFGESAAWTNPCLHFPVQLKRYQPSVSGECFSCRMHSADVHGSWFCRVPVGAMPMLWMHWECCSLGRAKGRVGRLAQRDTLAGQTLGTTLGRAVIPTPTSLLVPLFPSNSDLDSWASSQRGWCSHSVMPDSCDPMCYSPPGSSVHGFSRQEYCSGEPSLPPKGSSWSQVSCIAGRFFTHWAMTGAPGVSTSPSLESEEKSE